LKPIEELGGRVDLVVVLALWEDRHLMQIFGEPRAFPLTAGTMSERRRPFSRGDQRFESVFLQR
jgi:hypothetical protein